MIDKETRSAHSRGRNPDPAEDQGATATKTGHYRPSSSTRS
ncbi:MULTISPECIES: hypothetical protein [Cryobacterium]|nr:MULTISPECIES: hypothetical protein [Cryobacterium]